MGLLLGLARALATGLDLQKDEALGKRCKGD
jgi:hypothetical protein